MLQQVFTKEAEAVGAVNATDKQLDYLEEFLDVSCSKEVKEKGGKKKKKPGESTEGPTRVFKCPPKMCPIYFEDQEGCPTTASLGTLAQTWKVWKARIEDAVGQKRRLAVQAVSSVNSNLVETTSIRYAPPNPDVDRINCGLGTGRGDGDRAIKDAVKAVQFVFGKQKARYPTVAEIKITVADIVDDILDIVDLFEAADNEKKAAAITSLDEGKSFLFKYFSDKLKNEKPEELTKYLNSLKKFLEPEDSTEYFASRIGCDVRPDDWKPVERKVGCKHFVVDLLLREGYPDQPDIDPTGAGRRFGIVLCDPPYGLGKHEARQCTEGAPGWDEQAWEGKEVDTLLKNLKAKDLLEEDYVVILFPPTLKEEGYANALKDHGCKHIAVFYWVKEEHFRFDSPDRLSQFVVPIVMGSHRRNKVGLLVSSCFGCHENHVKVCVIVEGTDSLHNNSIITK